MIEERARWLASAPARLPLALALVALTSGAQYSGQGPPSDSGVYLVPNALVSLLGDDATPVHQYRDSLLASVPALATLPRQVQSRITAVQDTGSIFFRDLVRNASPWSRNEVEGLAEGDYFVAFWGPIDPAWRAALSALGLVVLDNAAPYALLVHGRGEELVGLETVTTSFGFDAVRSVEPLPVEARLDPSLRALSRGGAPARGLARARGLSVVRVQARTESTAASLVARLRSTVEPAPEALSQGEANVFLVEPAELLGLLESHPEITYIEAVHERELHDNLAAKGYILDVEPAWTDPSLGYDGGGVIVDHNDSGVDLSHPDFPAGVVLATAGAMSGTDNGHGTHTAGSILGRGLAATSPTNTSSCGDAMAALGTVRGMGWGASLVTNNIFSGGFASEAAMLRWGSQQGAHISTNSWGYTNLYTYSSQASTVDGLVRDADASSSGNQELLVFFSAGNDGPGSGTVISPGTAKNALTVGASQNDRCGSYVPSRCSGPDIDSMACFSGRGPSQGRIKPDLVAVGTDVLAAESSDPLATYAWDQSWTGSAYALNNGTSMSTPLAAGAAAVFFQFYRDRFGRYPSPALAKAALINGAVDMGLGYPSFDQGWGRLDLRKAIEGPPGGGIRFLDQTETTPLATGGSWSATLEVFSSATPLEVTLVWTDVPGASGASLPLVNDLNLVVIDPSGIVYRGNQLTASWSTPDPGPVSDTANNVENVFVRTPAAGRFTVEVSSALTSTPPPGLSGQDFALVYSGDAGDCLPPAPPTGLVATAPSSNRIELLWTAEPAAASYRVYRSESSGGGFVEMGTATSPSYVDLAVSGGTTYFYRVSVVSASGCESTPSGEASVTAVGDCTLPPAFGGLGSVSTASSGCALELDWPPATAACSGGASVYNVYRSTVRGFTPRPGNLLEVCVTANTYTDTNVGSGTNYYYVVRAEDASLAGGGPCRGGNVDANLFERSGAPSATATTLYANDFEGADDFVHAPESAGLGDSWRGIQMGCPAASGSGLYRFGGASCSANYSNDNFASAGPGGPVRVPASALNVAASFRHRWQFEQDGLGVYDGGYIEASVDGTRFAPVAAGRLGGAGYDAVIDGSCSNGVGNAVFSGTSSGYASGAYLTTTVDLDGVCNDILGMATGCAGHDVHLRFTSVTDCTAGRDGWFLDDVSVSADLAGACTALPDPVPYFTVTSSEGVNALEWLNPASGETVSLIFRTDRFPAGPSDGTVLTPPAGTAGSPQSFVHAPLVNGTTYYYGAFVTNAGGDVSSGRLAEGRPAALAPGAWVYQTGASAVSPVAPGPGTAHAVANDRILHGMTGGSGGGLWPPGWVPIALNGPEARPPILPMSLSGASRVLLATTLDGTVQAIDADSGASLWASPVLAERFTGGAAAMLTTFGGSYDLAFVGTRNVSTGNALVALRLADGLPAWQFDNGGGSGAIGVIGSSSSVRYGRDELLFASRSRAGGSASTLWSISFTDTSAALAWDRALGDIDGSPAVWEGRVYVGNNAGRVYALDPDSGVDLWAAPFDTGDGPVKGYVFPSFGTGALYVATTSRVTAIVDEGATATEKWRVTSIPSPSTPLLIPGTTLIFVGGGDGRLYRLDLTTSPPGITSTVLGDGSAALGPPSFSVAESTLYIGSTSGAIYAIPLVLP